MPTDLRSCLAAETLLAQVAHDGPAQLSRRLERVAGPEARRAALELADLRRRAAGRLWRAEDLLLTAKGLEQASSSAVAVWRQRTLDAREPRGLPAVDLTAGLGLDAAALAEGRGVVAQDLDPLTASLCGENLSRLAPGRAVSVRADALRPAARAALVGIDPDRRPRGRRELDPAAWSPAWGPAAALLAEADGGWAKLPPAVEVDQIEGALPDRLARSWSFVARGRELIEATLWTGCLADGEQPTEAISVDEQGQVATRIGGAPGPALAALTIEQAEGVDWILEPHPALLRSGLVAHLADPAGARPLGPRLGFLGPRSPGTPPPAPGPLWSVNAVLDSAPADPRKVRRMLAKHGVGPVRVTVRGHPESAEELARRFRGKGKARGRLLVARLARGHRVYLVSGSKVG
jgi:hypothetical protein